MYGASHGPYPSSVGSTVRGPDEVSLSGRPLTVEITATTKKIPNTLALYINENDGTNIGANGRIGVILVTSESKTLPWSYGSESLYGPGSSPPHWPKKKSCRCRGATLPGQRWPGHGQRSPARASATVTGHRHFWELDLETWNKPALKALTLAVTRTAPPIPWPSTVPGPSQRS